MGLLVDPPVQALAQDQRAVLEQLLGVCDGLQHIQVSFSVSM